MNTQQYNATIKMLSDRVFGYAFKLCKQKEWAKDLVQNSYIKLWENREKVSPEFAKAFLFKVLYRNMIDDIRKNKRMDYTDSVPDQSNSSRDDLENRDQINTAFDQLKENQRSIILLRDWEGYSYEEIAEILSISLAQVKVNLFRARKKMRSIIIILEAESKNIKYGNQ